MRAAALILLSQIPVTLAHGCPSALSCDSDIDSFFIGLIAGAGAGAYGGARMPAPHPVFMPALSPLPADGGPFVIPPPAGAAGPPPAKAPEPTRPYLLEQWLVAGQVTDGGESWMYMRTSPGGGAAQDTLPPLARTGSIGGVGEWQSTRRLALPVFPAWPLQPVSQPVGMTVRCGACGDGAHAKMTGGGVIEFSLAGHGMPDATGSMIRDIALRGPAGLAADGMIRFVLRDAKGPVATAEKARLLLDFGDYRADVRLHLLVWLHADGRAGGAFTGVTGDPEWGLGALAGYFSGAGCTPACGVEN